MDVRELLVLVWSLKLSTDHIFEAVVGNDMVMCSLVFNRDCLLHQTSLFELVAVDERPAEPTLLVRREALSEVGVDLVVRIRIGSIVRWVFKFVIGVVDILPCPCDGGASAFLALPFGTTRGVQGRLLLLWFECAYELPVDQAIVHHATWGPMNSISPALDA